METRNSLYFMLRALIHFLDSFLDDTSQHVLVERIEFRHGGSIYQRVSMVYTGQAIQEIRL